jgi:hypothetical protein
MMNAHDFITAPTPACVCGWNTAEHNGELNTPKTCPAVKAATKQLFDQGFSTTRMTRWSNYYIDPDDVAILVLNAVKAQQDAEHAARAEAFESERLADVIPITVKRVKTSSSPISLDPHDAYYRPPFAGHAAA